MSPAISGGLPGALVFITKWPETPESFLLFSVYDFGYICFEFKNIFSLLSGHFRMNPPLADDTDEENCDDPIKLFDNNLNAIYFGSKPLVHSKLKLFRFIHSFYNACVHRCHHGSVGFFR